ncbi:ABC transporter permease [Halomonas sp. MCCC 1A11058]|uniref:ABC transporter permease n=1 Tax=Billgrantia aerodenitrificans TaxID=2733483 RepID=A0ABS9AV08_9GAMM|nr:ABC transporter permease [Halomonas aerodenitrificans]
MPHIRRVRHRLRRFHARRSALKATAIHDRQAAASAIDPSLRHRRREHVLMMLLMSPAVLVVFALLVVPLSWLIVQSFYADGALSLAHYRRIFTEGIYWNTFYLTFRISVIVTLLALLMGYPIAYAASILPKRWAMLILALVILPFWTSVLVRAYAWLILLQRSGVVNQTLMASGITDAPLPLVHNELGTIIATVHILLPFMVLPLYATMQKIPQDLVLAGSSLGGSPLHVFMRVFFPLSLSGVLAGMTLVFVLCLGFYITPELVGGGRTVMASMLVSRNIQLYSDWGAASAVSVVLLICVLIIFYVVSRLVPLEKILGAK